MNSIRSDKYSRIAALKPAPRRGNGSSRDADEAERGGRPDELALAGGGTVARNSFGEHLRFTRWHDEAPEFLPHPDVLPLLLPSPTERASHGAQRSMRGRAAGCASHADILAAAGDAQQWLFLDTETTGLAGGTGTYAFLIGMAWWEAGGLQVEQLFMRDFGEEHALLEALAARLAERRVLVTFNGRTFDWPLLDTRFRMTRTIRPPAPLAHLDLLHAARSLWRMRLPSLKLTELERHVLGFDRGPDLWSAMIPQMYFDYLRGVTNSAAPLVDVLRHNRMDLVGLAALAGRIFSLLAAPETAECDALELCGVSRLLKRRGQPQRARLIYEKALAAGLPAELDCAARRELARLAKRDRDFDRATELWSGLCGARNSLAETDNTLTLPAGGDADAALEAFEQLAIYHEHHARQPHRAAELTCEALAALSAAHRNGGVSHAQHRRLRHRLEHRLARLKRRGAASAVQGTLAANA